MMMRRKTLTFLSSLPAGLVDPTGPAGVANSAPLSSLVAAGSSHNISPNSNGACAASTRPLTRLPPTRWISTSSSGATFEPFPTLFGHRPLASPILCWRVRVPFGGLESTRALWIAQNCVHVVLSLGGKHRNPAQGEYALTEEAREHDRLLLKLGFLLNWCLAKNPDAIIVIENPEALLRKMPIMRQMCSDLNLHMATVHYCTCDRPDKKPTNLWTNVSVCLCLVLLGLKTMFILSIFVVS
jgi:hypothetical protein